MSKFIRSCPLMLMLSWNIMFRVQWWSSDVSAECSSWRNEISYSDKWQVLGSGGVPSVPGNTGQEVGLQVRDTTHLSIVLLHQAKYCFTLQIWFQRQSSCSSTSEYHHHHYYYYFRGLCFYTRISENDVQRVKRSLTCNGETASIWQVLDDGRPSLEK